MSVDKTQVREDYLRGFSVRMLAAKYGVPKSTINDWVKRYGWVQEEKQRYVAPRQIPRTSDEKPDSSDASDASGMGSTDYAEMRSYALKVLSKADQLLELDDALAPRDLKSLSSMLLDVRTLLHTLSPLEEEEQRLRLAALRKQNEEKEKESVAVVVQFVGTEGSEA